jgi:hypothetical protein
MPVHRRELFLVVGTCAASLVSVQFWQRGRGAGPSLGTQQPMTMGVGSWQLLKIEGWRCVRGGTIGDRSAGDEKGWPSAQIPSVYRLTEIGVVPSCKGKGGFVLFVWEET